jgi:hypothetical protein
LDRFSVRLELFLASCLLGGAQDPFARGAAKDARGAQRYQDRDRKQSGGNACADYHRRTHHSLRQVDVHLGSVCV